MSYNVLERFVEKKAVYFVRLKAHPSVPNASLANLNDFPNADVPGLVKKYPDVRK